jgi:hypothetical protein
MGALPRKRLSFSCCFLNLFSNSLPQHFPITSSREMRTPNKRSCLGALYSQRTAGEAAGPPGIPRNIIGGALASVPTGTNVTQRPDTSRATRAPSPVPLQEFHAMTLEGRRPRRPLTSANVSRIQLCGESTRPRSALTRIVPENTIDNPHDFRGESRDNARGSKVLFKLSELASTQNHGAHVLIF